MTSLVWFRDDLRLSDNPALTAGAADPEGVICVYLYDQESLELRRLGAATRWWLHHSLDALGQCLSQRGATLILRRGPARRVIPELVAETGSTSVFWNRRYGPGERVVDADIKTMLQAVGVQAQSFPANLLHEPWTVTTSAGTPYRVYSAYWRACLQLPPPRHPIPVPATLPASSRDPHSESLHALRLLPHDPDWSGGLAKRWVPGEASAHRTLDRFLTTRIDSYPTGRDQLGQDLTSGLSPHLRFGEVSPHTVWDRATRSGASSTRSRSRTIPCASTPGARAAPAIRSSTPRCASSCAPATCTTVCA